MNGNGYPDVNNGGYSRPSGPDLVRPPSFHGRLFVFLTFPPIFFFVEKPQDLGSDVQLMVCEHCRKIVESSAYDAHVEDHMRKQRLDDIRAELDEAANDKEGVTVSGRAGVDFGILDAETPVEVYISVTSTAAAVSLRSSRMRSSERGDEHGLKYVDRNFLLSTE